MSILSLDELLLALGNMRLREGESSFTEQFLVKGLLYFVQGDAKCWWCTPATCTAAAEMLHLFSLEESKEVVAFKKALARQFLKCTSCVASYHQAKFALRERYNTRYDPALVETFFLSLEKWDAQRVKSELTRLTGIGDNGTARIVLYEALYERRYLLCYQDVAAAACVYIGSKVASGDVLNMGNVLLPGFITLCFSGDSKIRTWAWRSIKLATNKNVQTPVASVLLIFAGVLRMLAGRLDPANPYAVAKKSIEGMASITFEFSADDIWRGLRVVLGRLTAKVKEGVIEQLDGFPTIVCKALLGIEGAEFIDAIRAFSDVISAADRSEIWPRVAQAMFCTPKDFVQLIINHPAVRDKFHAGDTTAEYSDAMLETQNRHLRPVLEWVTPLIGSLALPQDAPAVVALLNGLLFTIRQDSTVPLANLALAVHTAIAIVKHCFKLPTVEKFDEFGVFVLGDFLNKNLGTIVGIAQGQDPLSQSEMLITRAEELIDTMLREDLDITYDAFCQISVTAQSIRDNPAVLEEHDFEDPSTVPTLIQFPELWAAVLQNPHNTNVVNRALFAASYLILFDPLPADLTRHLPPLWRKSYARFERKRDAIADMAKQLLQILADSLDSVDAETRMEFEREALATQLRCLVSPARSIHAVVLRILRINLLESGDGGGLESSEDSAGGGRSISELGDAERDMVCYELFNRHHEHFVDCLAGISNDCKILVNFSRPAYTCAANVALLARSSISAASGLIDPGSSEAMARLFFAFCGLLASILKASSENAIQIDNRSIYMDSVLVVFQTVYNMLNAVEFSNFVRLVKGSKQLNETEAIDALSNCVAQMFTYLEGDDELHVASGIIKTFGLVASGLAATPGTSMLYPVETVQGLISGRTGRLSTELRTLLRSITSQSVWEPRSISISKTKSVRIIIDDDEDAFAAMNDYDLSDILGNLDDEEQLQAEPRKGSEPALLPDRQQSVCPAYESAPTPVMKPVYQPSTAPAEGTSRASMYALPAASADVGRGVESLDISKAPTKESDDDVREIQWTAEDALISVRRKQSSMDYWFGKPKSGGSLTSQLSQSKAAAVAAAAKPRAGSTTSAATLSSTRSKKPPGGGLLGQMRSNFAKERQGLALNLPKTTPAVPKQIVQAPRAMATVSVDRWAEDRFSQTSAPPKVQPPMYVRNVSKAAIIELEKENGTKSIELIESGDSDSASSSDEEDGSADKRGGGLAGLIKIAKAPVKEIPARRMKLLPLLGGAHGVAFGSIGGGSVFFDQQARDRAVAERKAKARLMPSMSKLHTQMLEWQYDESGDIPPQMRKSDICRIPDRFNDCDQYINILEPLLLLESWAQFQRAKEETLSSDIGEATLESRMSMDAFQEITYNLGLADMKELSENDILVFAESMEREKRKFQGIPAIGKSAGATANNNGSGGNRQFAGRKTFLAMVKSRTFKRDGGQVVVRVYFEGARLATFLNILVLKSTWSFLKLFSITPIHREYAALRSLPYLNEQLVEKILQPHRSNVGQVLSRTEVQKCMKTHALNQPQAEAVTAAIKRDNGFTLIQGPPGTGKTKTILGLAGALLSMAKQNARREALNADPSDYTSSVAPKTNNKLLICAPSNAAVDEIVKRLKCGIRNDDGRTFFPRVVRVGQSDSISSTVRDTTLDFLLDKALNAFSGGGDSNSITEDKGISDSQSSMLLEIAGRSRREGKIVTQAVSAKQDQRTAMDSQQNLRREVNETMAEIESLNEKMTKVESSDISTMLGLRETLHQAHQKKRALYQKLDNERARVREATRTMDATKHKVRLQILQKTDILCCTLSGSGHEILTTLNCTFDTVIIDEAAQSIELSCLIPLKYGCERCILVGDPNQLPPTVLSQTAAQYMYNQSMFVRIQKNSPQSVSLLSIQYRMHPEISVFPSRLFYESRLKDGPEMAKKQLAVWHKSAKFPPYTFFNISSGREETGSSHSVFNMAEINAAIQLVYNLCTDYPHVNWKQKIGIITPYKQQLRKLVDRFRGFFGQNIMDAIEFNTVDGFQGQEKDIIIFSCVRAGGSGVGFLADERRMNVGLTRARKSLFVLGNADLLVSSPLWKQLIADSKSRGLLRASSLPLFGCEVHSGKRFDNLFSDQAADAQGGVDGEGDKSEFIMEAIDELALEKRNEATMHNDAPIDSSTDETAGLAMEVDMHREIPSVAAQGQFSCSHSRRPSNASSISSDREHFAHKPNVVSREPINGDVRSESNIQMSASTAFRRPARSPTRVLNASRPPINLHAQMALERKKQHSSLFIPSKRGGRGGGVRGPVTGKAPSGQPLNYTLPAESLPPAVLREFAHPPLPLPMLPPPLPPSSSPPPSRSLSKDNSRSNRRNSRDCSRSPSRRSEKHRDRHDDRRDDRKSRDRRDRSRDRHRHSNSKDSSKRSSDTGTPSTSSVKRPRRKGGLFRPSASTENVGRRSRSDRDYDGKVDRDDLISGMLERRY